MSQADLIIASPEQNADLFYISRFLAPDPIIFFATRHKSYLILNDLEIDRGRMEAKVDEVLSLTTLRAKASKTRKQVSPLINILAVALRQRHVQKINVPSTFPALYLNDLKKLGYRVTVKTDPFFPQRLIKSTAEKNAIKRTLQHVRAAFQRVYDILGEAKIRGNEIYWGQEKLTSEFMKKIINGLLMERGCVARNTIVACGAQASLPHHHGHGPLRPHQTIIFDIFPQNEQNRYWGDMTRTILKGKASPESKRAYQAVLKANRYGREHARVGTTTKEIHNNVARILCEAGFQTRNNRGRMEGFIHSTGHGLGLDIHELPSVSPSGARLVAGHVITIEPGLYYQRLGGIRIEDVVHVTRDGPELLTPFPRTFEIP